ncbi:hypothetical protein [Polymorphospora rubra]|uniref:Sulfotransferase family protein n=1 Tax=Polymorphospora rubra TaxID=338584 RepID=A0A810NAG6_9ACTN|nr:hypothetical protein [Polymorphospora rubra]BCJ68818.1 hypothetical protein Prubr_58390 [Polymorphospora rubra]
MSHPVIALWAAPRTRSTAFLRMIIERGDLLVVHEPLSNLAALGTVDVGGTPATSETEVLDLLLDLAATSGRRVFVKETTDYRYPGVLADPRLHTHLANTFMIRDPAAVVASHHAMNRSVDLDEIGFERLHEIFEAVRGPLGEAPVVIDGDDLVADPEGVVAAFCARTGLPFDPAALRWESTPRKEWDRTRDWHQDVERSTGFTTQTTRHAVRVDNDPRLAALAAHHQPFYDRLYAHRLPPRTAAEQPTGT